MQQINTETINNISVVFETNGRQIVVEEPKRLKWTKDEYHRLAELGLFEGKRTEFLEGEIVEMSIMNSPHATALTLTDESLREIFSKGFAFRNQMPLDFGEDFEPVPDIAIVKGSARDFKDSHPRAANLVVEISDTTLTYDRNRKFSLYAKAGVQDYWILNLKNNTLEVYRHPTEDENTFYGFGYGEKLTLDENQEVSPLAAPDAKIKVSDLLP